MASLKEIINVLKKINNISKNKVVSDLQFKQTERKIDKVVKIEKELNKICNKLKLCTPEEQKILLIRLNRIYYDLLSRFHAVDKLIWKLSSNCKNDYQSET
ncbi:MAG: hypothetical protein WC707_04735 [Candidatus Babeliaceae bacterium]|jgi:hypothetical protein